jgi:hypothetical protein
VLLDADFARLRPGDALDETLGNGGAALPQRGRSSFQSPG